MNNSIKKHEEHAMSNKTDPTAIGFSLKKPSKTIFHGADGRARDSLAQGMGRQCPRTAHGQ
jgi:hypothetical protein